MELLDRLAPQELVDQLDQRVLAAAGTPNANTVKAPLTGGDQRGGHGFADAHTVDG